MSPMSEADKALLETLLDLLAALYAGPGQNRGECLEFLAHVESFSAGAKLKSLPPPTAAALENLLQAWTPAYEARNAFCEEMESEYVRVFVNTKGGVAASLYHSVWEPGSTGVMGAAHTAMLARLKEEGLALDDAVAQGEPADHLCAELEYLRHLLLQGKEPEAREFATAMLGWVRRLTSAAEAAEVPAPYAAAGRLLCATLESLASG